jgi:hypothetical protein
VASMDSPIGEDGIIGKIDWAAPIREKGAGMNGCSWEFAGGLRQRTDGRRLRSI